MNFSVNTFWIDRKRKSIVLARLKTIQPEKKSAPIKKSRETDSGHLMFALLDTTDKQAKKFLCQQHSIISQSLHLSKKCLKRLADPEMPLVESVNHEMNAWMMRK